VEEKARPPDRGSPRLSREVLQKERAVAVIGEKFRGKEKKKSLVNSTRSNSTEKSPFGKGRDCSLKKIMEERLLSKKEKKKSILTAAHRMGCKKMGG